MKDHSSQMPTPVHMPPRGATTGIHKTKEEVTQSQLPSGDGLESAGQVVASEPLQPVVTRRIPPGPGPKWVKVADMKPPANGLYRCKVVILYGQLNPFNQAEKVELEYRDGRFIWDAAEDEPEYDLTDNVKEWLFPVAVPSAQPPNFKRLRSIWPVINHFRGQLIDRAISGGVLPEEKALLDALQVFADWYLEIAAPRDTSILEKLEKLAAPVAPLDENNQF